MGEEEKRRTVIIYSHTFRDLGSAMRQHDQLTDAVNAFIEDKDNYDYDNTIYLTEEGDILLQFDVYKYEKGD
jgi:hypothetical protein